MPAAAAAATAAATSTFAATVITAIIIVQTFTIFFARREPPLLVYINCLLLQIAKMALEWPIYFARLFPADAILGLNDIVANVVAVSHNQIIFLDEEKVSKVTDGEKSWLSYPSS